MKAHKSMESQFHHHCLMIAKKKKCLNCCFRSYLKNQEKSNLDRITSNQTVFAEASGSMEENVINARPSYHYIEQEKPEWCQQIKH